jgi:hypothetical protein
LTPCDDPGYLVTKARIQHLVDRTIDDPKLRQALFQQSDDHGELPHVRDELAGAVERIDKSDARFPTGLFRHRAFLRHHSIIGKFPLEARYDDLPRSQIGIRHRIVRSLVSDF